MSEWIEDLKKIKAREEAEDLNPDEVLELHIEAFIRDYARKKMADGSPCPCCGARQRVKAAGGRGEGRVPYGRADKHGVVRPGEAEILADLKAWHASGVSCALMAETLNSQERLTRYGRQWRDTTIRRMLAAL